MVHGIEGEYWGRIDFLYIDREDVDNQEVTQRFGVRSQPVFVVLDAEGNEMTRLFGYVSEADLRAALDGVLG